MKLSVIIPAYQCGATLRETVTRVLGIGLPLAELLLIDDGSTDGTAALCDALAGEYPAVRCVHKPNGGVSSARNLGIEEARGDYLWFVDADDGALPLPAAALEELERSQPGVVLFGMEFRYFRGERLMKTEALRMDQRLLLERNELGPRFAELFRTNYLSPVWNKLFRRSLLLESGVRFDRGLTNYEDLAFSLEAMAHSARCLVLPEICYQYNTDYDHDRTVDRIAKIDAVAANTDLIAKRFFELADRCGFAGEDREALKAIVLQIYLDLFWVKMQTAPLGEVRKHCAEFAANRNFRECAEALPRLSEGSRRLCGQLVAGKALPIWTRVRYRSVRARAVRAVKPLLKRGGI